MLGSEKIPESEVFRALEYSRYLVAMGTSQPTFVAKVKADILAALWGYAARMTGNASV